MNLPLGNIPFSGYLCMQVFIFRCMGVVAARTREFMFGCMWVSARTHVFVWVHVGECTYA